jgi:hypothetical protein
VPQPTTLPRAPSNADANTKPDDSASKFHSSSLTFNEKNIYIWVTTFSDPHSYNRGKKPINTHRCKETAHTLGCQRAYHYFPKILPIEFFQGDGLHKLIKFNQNH